MTVYPSDGTYPFYILILSPGCTAAAGETKYRVVPNPEYLPKYSVKYYQIAMENTVSKLHIQLQYRKSKNSPMECRPRAGTKVRRFGNLAPCRVTDSHVPIYFLS